MDKKHYVEAVSEALSQYYEPERHGTPEAFIEIVSKSVENTIAFYDENYDFEDDEFDWEVFRSDLLSDARKALK